MNILSYFNGLTLTADQNQAVSKIEAFLKEDQQVFLLKGYAGTGKTTLLRGLCKYLEAQKRGFRLMAPTGRAAMILAQKTEIKASTIHRGIFNMDKLQEREDGNSFKFFYQLRVNEDSTNCIYLVDEASMISDVFADGEFFTFGSGCLLQDLKSFALSGETNRKIIFIGDDAQLPPVNMPFSPALSDSYLAENFSLSVEETTLRQVVRQDTDSGILEKATSLRDALATTTFNKFELPYHKEDVDKIPPESFLDQYMRIAKSGDVENLMVLSHSNRQALKFNLEVRSIRYGNDDPQVKKRDRLLITKNNYNGPVELFNGMFARVIEVGDISRTAKPRFKIEGGKTVERELVFRDILVEVKNVNGNEHQLKTTLLDRFLTAEEGRLHPHDQRALYIDFKNRVGEQGIRPGTDTFREALKNDLYFNALQAKYGYAITCHKAQGGEWDNIIIDFKVYMGLLSSSFFRWAYTAITRARKHLYCIDAPNYTALSNFIVRDITGMPRDLKEAFYVPKLEENPFYFKDYRKERIKQLCKEQNVDVQFAEQDYQLRVAFGQEDKKTKCQLWYSKNGFTKVSWDKETDDTLKELAQDLLMESLLPEKVPFEPKFSFQQELHQYFMDLLKEEDLLLTNVVQHEWSDQYFIQTDASCTVVEFFFNKKHHYTKAVPKSTLGQKDEKMQRLIAKLKGG